jgi:hypothetical protein
MWADDRLAGQRRWFWVVVHQPELAIEEECVHRCLIRETEQRTVDKKQCFGAL